MEPFKRGLQIYLQLEYPDGKGQSLQTVLIDHEYNVAMQRLSLHVRELPHGYVYSPVDVMVEKLNGIELTEGDARRLHEAIYTRTRAGNAVPEGEQAYEPLDTERAQSWDKETPEAPTVLRQSGVENIMAAYRDAISRVDTVAEHLTDALKRVNQCEKDIERVKRHEVLTREMVIDTRGTLSTVIRKINPLMAERKRKGK